MNGGAPSPAAHAELAALWRETYPFTPAPSEVALRVRPGQVSVSYPLTPARPWRFTLILRLQPTGKSDFALLRSR